LLILTPDYMAMLRMFKLRARHQHVFPSLWSGGREGGLYCTHYLLPWLLFTSSLYYKEQLDHVFEHFSVFIYDSYRVIRVCKRKRVLPVNVIQTPTHTPKYIREQSGIVSKQVYKTLKQIKCEVYNISALFLLNSGK